MISAWSLVYSCVAIVAACSGSPPPFSSTYSGGIAHQTWAAFLQTLGWVEEVYNTYSGGIAHLTWAAFLQTLGWVETRPSFDPVAQWAGSCHSGLYTAGEKRYVKCAYHHTYIHSGYKMLITYPTSRGRRHALPIKKQLYSRSFT